MAKPDLALPVDLDPVYPSVSGISAVGTAVVHQQPMTVVQAKHSMLPRHAGISDDDVALRIAADPVRGPCRQAPVKSLGLQDERWCRPPRKGLLGHAPTLERFI